MGGDGPVNGIMIPLLAAVFLSVALAGIGWAMHKRGYFRTRTPALIWAILTVLPLFGAGALMFAKHTADEITGVTESGKSEYDSRGAP